MPRIVYGPLPGTEVAFDLVVAPPEPIPDGRGGFFKLDPPGDVKGDTIRVTAKVPSDANKRVLNAIVHSRPRVGEDGHTLVLQTAAQMSDEFERKVLEMLVVRIEGYEIADPIGSASREIHTVAELLELGEPAVCSALVDVLMDRVRLNEALAKNSGGRSPSSKAENPPSGGTAESAGSKASVDPARATAPSRKGKSTSPSSV